MKKFFQIFTKIRYKEVVLPFLGFIGVFVAVGFVEVRHEQRTISKININIDKEYDNYFIDQEDVMNLLTDNGRVELIGDNHDRVNLKELENKVEKNSFAHNVEVYRDVKGDLTVDVEQCKPIARILRSDGNDFYVSNYGTVVPLSNKFTARVIIVDGAYTNRFPEGKFGEDSITKPYFDLLTKIEGDEFLKPLVTQMSIDSDGRIYLYPQLGDQVFELGPPTDINHKLGKIRIFYDKIVPKMGWNKYKRINLAYLGQIISE